MAERQQDEYKPLRFYKKHSTQRKYGFSKFEVEGEYYFCRYVDDEICMISQSYVGVSGRDNGIESVKKNSKLAKRYRFEERGSKHGFSLIAGNHQEIAISPDYTSKSKAEFAAGRMRGAIKAPSSAKTSSSKAKTAATGAALASGAKGVAKAAKLEDDYKPLAFYERQTKGREHGIETFKGDDGEHYFAYFENGKIALISEGYPTTAARDNGVASVEKNVSIEDRYQYRGPLKNGKYDFKLKAGNNKEIARSVWYSSAAAAATGAAYLMGKRKRGSAVPIAGATLAASAMPTTAMASSSKKEATAKTAAPIAAAALATGAIAASTPAKAEVVPTPPPADTEPYYENDGGIWKWLKWLLLALLMLLALFFLLKACGGSDKEAVLTPAIEPEVTVVSCWNGSEANTLEACPAKITCWDGSFVTSEAACPVEITAVTCWDGSTAETNAACPIEPAPAPVVEPERMVAEPVQTIRNTGAVLGAASIFAPGGVEAVMVSRLGTNPEFGDSHSLTPSGFYDKLAVRYATNEYDRQYLDYLFKELGYVGGFKDVTAAAFTNDTVANGARGILGYSPAHAYQYSEFNMTDVRDLEAFRIQALNGKDIYFMKTCGNYFYITG